MIPGSRVRRFGDKHSKLGTVVEIGTGTDEGRVRILWDGKPSSFQSERPKRTWCKMSMLVEAIESIGD